jgi:hypothetical protein
MLIHFIHGYYCIYRPWQPLTYLYFPYYISLIYFSFTKIHMFLYARIYWLAEFGDVSCLQFNYLRVETLTPTWEDFVEQFCRTILSDNFKSEVRQNSVSDLRIWSLIHLEGSVYQYFKPILSKLTIDPEIFSLNCLTVIWNKKWCLINPMGTNCAPFLPTCSFIHTRNTSYRGFWRKTTRS